MDRPSVWFVSPAFRRFAVTRLVLAQRQRLIGELAGRGLDAHSLVVADDENLDIARDYGAVGVEHPNLPLGAKCNAGLRYACEQGADWIVWIGSDDWVHADCFDPLVDEYANAPRNRTRPILLGHRIAAVDLATGKLRRLRHGTRFGVIPWIVPRQLLTRSEFEPVRPQSNRGLDGALIRGMNRSRSRPTFHYHTPHDLRAVDFKTDTNLNTYDAISRALGVGPEEPAWAALEEHYPADLVAMARDTHQELTGGR